MKKAPVMFISICLAVFMHACLFFARIGQTHEQQTAPKIAVRISNTAPSKLPLPEPEKSEPKAEPREAKPRSESQKESNNIEKIQPKHQEKPYLKKKSKPLNKEQRSKLPKPKNKTQEIASPPSNLSSTERTQKRTGIQEDHLFEKSDPAHLFHTQKDSTSIDANMWRANYLAMVSATIEKNKNYPIIARRRGLEGVAMIVLILDSKGTIVIKRIEKGTGHAILDKAILEQLANIQSFPRPEILDKEGRFTCRVPIRFHLKK